MRVLDRLRPAARAAFRPRRPGRLGVLLLLAAGLLVWHGVRLARAGVEFGRAEAALGRYDFAAARAHAEAAGELRRGRPAVWLLAAQAARRDGAADAAAAHLKQYRAAAGPTPEGRLEEALQRVQGGDIRRDVRELMEKADAGHPAAEQILEALAVGSVHIYRFEDAGFWVRHLLDQFPRNPVGRMIRARMDDVLGKREKAAAGCRELLADFPDHAEAKALLAGLLFRDHRFTEAADLYEELRRRRPDDLRAAIGLTRCRNRMGQTAEARRLAGELEGRFGGRSEALLEAGRFALANGRGADAERLLRRAVELAPNDHEAHYHLGLCLEQAGKGDEARQHVERFQRIEADLVRLDALLKEVVNRPRDPSPRREAGLICLRNGQPGEGLRWLHGALEVAPDDRPTHAALADYYDGARDWTRAGHHRQRAQ